jgi:hypothetical protein
MNDKETTGHCLCGKVTIHLDGKPEKIDACHCASCRRWGSGPFFTLGSTRDVSIDGGDAVAIYESSEWASRAFCRNCGSHLYYFLKPTGQYMLSPGLFDDIDGLNLEVQVFIDEKPSYYSFSEDSRKLTGAEVLEMFARLQQAP